MTTEKEEIPKFFIYSDRIVSLICLKKINSDDLSRMYLLYRSTGYNSKYAHTWFPTSGFSSKNGLIFKPGHIKRYLEKDNEYTDHARQCFDPIFLNFIKYLFKEQNVFKGKNPLNSFLCRFGNMECMCLSYLIGGGYWDTEDAKPIIRFIELAYTENLKLLKKNIYDMQLENFKNISPKNLARIDEYDKANAQVSSIRKSYVQESQKLNNYEQLALDYNIDKEQLVANLKNKFSYLCFNYRSSPIFAVNSHLFDILN